MLPLKKKDSVTVNMEHINRCAVHLTGQIIFLQGVDEANCVESQTKDSGDKN